MQQHQQLHQQEKADEEKEEEEEVPELKEAFFVVHQLRQNGRLWVEEEEENTKWQNNNSLALEK